MGLNRHLSRIWILEEPKTRSFVIITLRRLQKRGHTQTHTPTPLQEGRKLSSAKFLFAVTDSSLHSHITLFLLPPSRKIQFPQTNPRRRSSSNFLQSVTNPLRRKRIIVQVWVIILDFRKFGTSTWPCACCSEGKNRFLMISWLWLHSQLFLGHSKSWEMVLDSSI